MKSLLFLAAFVLSILVAAAAATQVSAAPTGDTPISKGEHPRLLFTVETLKDIKAGLRGARAKGRST
jgi:hypothetical protein